MPINSHLNCAFVHIPKTGGTSIETALDMRKKECFFHGGPPLPEDFYNGWAIHPQHMTPAQCRKRIPGFDKMFKFTVIRDPYTRVLSDVLKTNCTQKELIRKIKKWARKKHSHRLSQIDYLTDCDYDFILTFENLSSDWEELCKKLGISVSLPHANKSKCNCNYDELLTAEVKELLDEVLQDEVFLLGEMQK